MTKDPPDPQRLTGIYVTKNPRPYSYICIDHPVLGLVGSMAYSRDPEAGTAVILLGGILMVEGREDLFIPGKDAIGTPFLEKAALERGVVIDAEAVPAQRALPR